MDQIMQNYGSDLSGSEDEQPVKSRKRKAYTTEWKLQVVKHAKQVSKKAASKKFTIDRSSVIEWVKKENQLKQLKESATDDKNKKKHPGGGRPLKFKDFDTQLAAWVRGRRSKKLKISRRTIQMKAQQMVSAEEDVVDIVVVERCRAFGATTFNNKPTLSIIPTLSNKPIL